MPVLASNSTAKPISATAYERRSSRPGPTPGAAPAERLAHYAKVAEHTLADRPLIYLWHNKWLYAMSKKLAGFTPYPDGLIRPKGIRLE